MTAAKLRANSAANDGLGRIGKYFWALDSEVGFSYLDGYEQALNGKGYSSIEETTKLLRAGVPVSQRAFLTPKGCAEAKGEIGKEFAEELGEVIERFEILSGGTFGGTHRPNLISVSDAYLGSVRNIGINENNIEVLANYYGKRKAYSIYVDFLESFATIVLQAPYSDFRKINNIRMGREATDDGLAAISLDEFMAMVDDYTKRVSQVAGKNFPARSERQLMVAIAALVRSQQKKQKNEIQLVRSLYRGKDEQSLEGSLYSCNPFTGENEVYGTVMNQDRDKFSLNPNSLETLPFLNQFHRGKIVASRKHVETATEIFRHDVEGHFVFDEAGHVYFQSFYRAELSARASIRSALNLESRRVISGKDAALRIRPQDLEQLLHPSLDPESRKDLVDLGAKGLPVSPGTVSGKVFFTMNECIKYAKEQADKKNALKPILMAEELIISDTPGLSILCGLVTTKGGASSHAAVMARGNGTPCIVGYENTTFLADHSAAMVNDKKISKGETITIDSSSEGRIYLGIGKVVQLGNDHILTAISQLFNRVKREHNIPLQIRNNINNAKDVRIAMGFGSDGVGLCRTENMFIKPEVLEDIRRLTLIPESEERSVILAKLEKIQRADFEDIFRELRGAEANIRLMDMPLHELMPKDEDQKKKLADKVATHLKVPSEEILARINGFHESNPMLGLRASRFGILQPDIYNMQIRAILNAAYAIRASSMKVRPGIMFPMIISVKELQTLRARVSAINEEVRLQYQDKFNDEIPVRVGAMIEVPAAALAADQIAPIAEFMAFGTNDLTQTTLGISRDDAMAFLPKYMDEGLLPAIPFETLHPTVEELITICVGRGRKARGSTKFGICGEQVGPATIEFCLSNGIDYVSCSAFRTLPINAMLIHFALGR